MWAPAARAKNPEQPETAVPVGSDMDFFDHDKLGPFWLGAEVNSIFEQLDDPAHRHMLEVVREHSRAESTWPVVACWSSGPRPEH